MKAIKVSTQPKADTKRLKVADLQPGPQMDALVAEARGWNVQGDTIGIPFQINEDGDIDFSLMPLDEYNPSGNGGQAFEVAELFNLVVNFEKMNAYHPDYLHSDFTDWKSIEAAICRAIISSAFGEEVSLSSDNVASRFGETVEVEE